MAAHASEMVNGSSNSTGGSRNSNDDSGGGPTTFPSDQHPHPQQAQRRRVTSLRSAQVPAGSAIVVTDGDNPAPTAIQILAARYSGNKANASASGGAPTTAGGGISGSVSAAADLALPMSGPNAASSSSSSSSSSSTTPASRRMSTPALSLLPPIPSSSSSSRSQGGGGGSHPPQHHPPSTALTRPVRRRREAGSLDFASSTRANSLTAGSAAAAAAAAGASAGSSRSPSPLPSSSSPSSSPAPTPNGLILPHEHANRLGAESIPLTTSSSAGPVDDLNSQTQGGGGGGGFLPPSPSQPSHLPRAGGAGSPTPSITSIRSTTTNSRQRRISTASGAPSFAQPTQASEQRRLANMTQLVNVLLSRNAGGSSTAMDDPTHPSKGGNAVPGGGANGAGGGKETTSTKVINALTTELDAVRSQLDTTSAQLAHAQRSLAALERDRDTLRDSVHRARTEADTLASQLQRKDRSVSDALERARRAEAESRERGRQGREWGARVRDIEDELGRERRERARVEAGYEAVALEWKRTRESWKAEVESLKLDMRKAQEKDRGELEALRMRVAEVSLLGRAMAAGSGSGSNAEEGGGGQSKLPLNKSKGNTAGDENDEDSLAPFRRVLQGLESERVKMETWAQTHIDSLVSQLETEQAHRASVEEGLEEVKKELGRILRLARQGLSG
ncbi:hypothetical protein A4X13_0g2397 [Tilletia indica]|uniref:SWI5-dependent HO expression protein 3 n=1 Tax=Tilletia indica TaxID=43049 RepID=A0A177TSH0_9BASI|nr:hypothetical protein A4X13_0g2397 [Tilletia indica]